MFRLPFSFLRNILFRNTDCDSRLCFSCHTQNSVGRQADQKNARSLQNNLPIYMKFECEITALKGTYKTVKVEKNSTVARVFCHLFFKTYNESNLVMVT